MSVSMEPTILIFILLTIAGVILMELANAR